jgi:hypothetical protein
MRNSIFNQFVIVSLQLLLISYSSFAEGPSIVDTNQLRSTTLTFTFSGRTIRKNIYCKSKTPGEVKKQAVGLLFTPISYSLLKERSKNKRSNKLPLMRELLKRALASCKSLPSPSPQPSAPPSATATPVATSAPNNFDAQGNLTAIGKAKFGVPSNLSGNIASGRSLHTSFCSGCHGEKINKNFSYLRSAISASPMFLTSADVDDGELAHLVAFLNRYRLQ